MKKYIESLKGMERYELHKLSEYYYGEMERYDEIGGKDGRDAYNNTKPYYDAIRRELDHRDGIETYVLRATFEYIIKAKSENDAKERFISVMEREGADMELIKDSINVRLRYEERPTGND